MSLTEEDRAVIREEARALMKEVMLEHIGSCPIGKSLMRDKALITGLCIGSGLVSGGIVGLFI